MTGPATLLALLALAAPTPGIATSRVSIVDNAFKPRSAAVNKGSALTWAWKGHRRHNVYFYSGPRAGRPRNCSSRRSGTCKRRFRRAGSYGYVCTLHGTMVGSVRVR